MERNTLTGKVTIEVDLGDFGKDLSYSFEDTLRDEVVGYIREHIRKSFLKDHHRMLNKWTKEYLEGKHPAGPDGVVMLEIPLELIRG
jgi:hypothetical protein